MTSVPARYHFIYDLNPNARLINAYRWALLDNISPPLSSVVGVAALSFLSLAVGYYLFKRMEPFFADYV